MWADGQTDHITECSIRAAWVLISLCLISCAVVSLSRLVLVLAWGAAPRMVLCGKLLCSLLYLQRPASKGQPLSTGMEPRALHMLLSPRLSVPCSSRLSCCTADGLSCFPCVLLSEYKFSARWTKVMGTAEWKASRTRRW